MDASDSAIGSLLQQSINGITQPLAFFSIQLKSTERWYSTFDLELLAIYFSVQHFQHQLEGKHFMIYTDHKPLTFALSSKIDKHSPRTFRHLDDISQFTSDIIWHFALTITSCPRTTHSTDYLIPVRLTVRITDDILCHKSIQSTFDSLYGLSSPRTTHSIYSAYNSL